MLISFPKSDQPKVLLNVTQIVACDFFIKCHELKQEVPSFVNVMKAGTKLGCNRCRVLLVSGKETIMEVADHDIVDSPEGLVFGRTKWDYSNNCFVIAEKKGIILEQDTPECCIRIGVPESVIPLYNYDYDNGLFNNIIIFTYYSVEEYLLAINALIEAMGGLRAVE